MHLTAPTELMYSSVVSRDNICLAFFNAALNDLEVFACDIGNAYLNSNTREKVYTAAGAGFGARIRCRLFRVC